MTRVPDRHESTRPTSGIQPAIEISDVTLELGGRRILDKVRFTVEAGEFVGVLGPNGAGKTTLMRALLGLVPIREGSVRVLGTPVSLIPAAFSAAACTQALAIPLRRRRAPRPK